MQIFTAAIHNHQKLTNNPNAHQLVNRYVSSTQWTEKEQTTNPHNLGESTKHYIK